MSPYWLVHESLSQRDVMTLRTAVLFPCEHELHARVTKCTPADLCLHLGWGDGVTCEAERPRAAPHLCVLDGARHAVGGQSAPRPARLHISVHVAPGLDRDGLHRIVAIGSLHAADFFAHQPRQLDALALPGAYP